LKFASSDNKISKNGENNNIADDTIVTEGNKSTYTAPEPKTCTVKTSENAEINIVQRPSKSSKRTEISS